MASEIQISGKITVKLGNLSISRDISCRSDMAEGDYASGTLKLTTFPHYIDYPSVINVGYGIFRNLNPLSTDAAIEIGCDELNEYGQLKHPCAFLLPGEIALFPLVSSELYVAKAVGGNGTAQLEYLILSR